MWGGRVPPLVCRPAGPLHARWEGWHPFLCNVCKHGATQGAAGAAPLWLLALIQSQCSGRHAPLPAACRGPARPAAPAAARCLPPPTQLPWIPTHPLLPLFSCLPQAARDQVSAINVTPDVIEVSLANCECDDLEGHGHSGGKALPGAANHVEQPGWERLMGINSFSIERALQVRCGCCRCGGVWQGGAAAGCRPSCRRTHACNPHSQPLTLPAAVATPTALPH